MASPLVSSESFNLSSLLNNFSKVCVSIFEVDCFKELRMEDLNDFFVSGENRISRLRSDEMFVSSISD